MSSSLEALREAYRAYVDTFRGADGHLPPMMQLKLVHTMKVVEAARRIAAEECFDDRTSLACEAAALLHDTGRYEQLRVYNTIPSITPSAPTTSSRRRVGWLVGTTVRRFCPRCSTITVVTFPTDSIR